MPAYVVWMRMSSPPTGLLSKENGANTPSLSLAAQAAVLPVPSLEAFLENAAEMSEKLESAMKLGRSEFQFKRLRESGHAICR